MIRSRLVTFLLIFVLLAGNLFFGLKYRQATATGSSEVSEEVSVENKKTVEFLKLFVSKVLQSENEVAFEDRLRLENDIRAIGDQMLFDRWTTFAKSETSEAAQQNLKDLLEALVNNIKLP